MDEKQLLARLIETAEQQSVESAVLLADLGLAIKTMGGVVPGIQKAAGEAISAEARVALAGATTEAIEAAGTLKRAAQWFGWKVFALAAAGMVGVCLVAWGSIWWPRHQMISLLEQKAELQADIEKMQVNLTTLEKKGGRIKLDKCGPDERLCVEITPNQGKSKSQEDFEGSWMDKSRKRRYVIPEGY